MERIVFEGTKRDIKKLRQLLKNEGFFFWSDEFSEVKQDFSIIDETFDAKLEIAKELESIGIPDYPKEKKIAEKLAKCAIEEWSDELLNAYPSEQNGLQYYIEQAILSGIDEFKNVK